MSLTLRSWQAPDRGALFVISGASGTGKTTLVKEALRRMPGLSFSVSATTRPARPGEVDGRDYHFVDPARFDRMIEDELLLEWAEVYGNRYGTPRTPVEDALGRGESILLDIDIQGARQVRRSLPEAVSIFVLPPDMDTMERRLRGRSTDSEEVIARRLAQARVQLQGAAESDYLVVNDDLQTAHDVLQSILVAELSRRDRRTTLAARFSG